MSADHDSSSTGRNRTAAPELRLSGDTRFEYSRDQEGATARRSPSPSVRTATIDRGGSPIEDPSPVHQSVAARNRLWGSYQRGGEDGCFVWTGPDPGGSGRE